MCGGGQEQLSHETLSPLPSSEIESLTEDMSNLTSIVDAESSSSRLLEFAADNNIEGFEQSFICSSKISEVGLWYGRQNTLKKMVCEVRTPLMIAARYGSVDILKLILSHSEVDVNFSCGLDKSTALHCAASGGSANVLEVVKLLLFAGADPNATDVNGHRPFDLIAAPVNLPGLKISLEELLKEAVSVCQDMHLSSGSLMYLSSSPEHRSLSSFSDATLSPVACKPNDVHVSSAAEKKEYPVDPSLPDINNSMYATDDFRMFSFKIRPCSRAYSHDWTECPFVHPGENARRRDLRKFHYSCVPCPDFRKGTCKNADLCEYAHGVFECWLHPAQYRTRLCKDGVSCVRRVCFFAHTAEELRPLYMSTGSALPSPRSATFAGAMDMAVALRMLPGSPSSVSAISPSPFTPPMSPSGNGIAHSPMAWPPQNIPTLHLPCSNFQSSRLRSSFSARDIPAEEFNTLQGFELQQQQVLHDLSCLTQPHINTSSPSPSVRPKTHTTSNLAEVSSPRYSDQLAGSSLFSPSHKSVFLNQLQQQQSMLSPIKTNIFSGKNVDNPFLEGSFGVSSPGRMSPLSMENFSPMNTRLSALAHQEKQHLQFCSLSSRDVGSNLPQTLGSNNAGNGGSPVNSWSKWESPNGKVDWSVQADELGCLRKSCSIGEEPDFSWVQSLVKETPFESKEMPAVSTWGKKLSADVYNSRNMG